LETRRHREDKVGHRLARELRGMLAWAAPRGITLRSGRIVGKPSTTGSATSRVRPDPNAIING
jgi:hypothetical protein